MEFPFPLVEKCKWAWFLGDFGSSFGTVNTRNRNFAFCFVVMTLYEPCSKEIEWNQPGICLQDKRGFTVERYNKLVALGYFLSVKESISELGNFPFPLDCGSSILCWQKHVIWFLPYRCIALTNIYYDRQSQQCFLLICYLSYRMSYYRLHVSVIVWPSSGLQSYHVHVLIMQRCVYCRT